LLTYVIRKHKAQPNTGVGECTRESILTSQLERTPIKVGDSVRFKKPRSRRICGTVLEIITDPTQIKWSKGVVPNCMKVNIDKIDLKTNIKYGEQIVFVSPKQLLLIPNKRIH
jgi:hypothetical protein